MILLNSTDYTFCNDKDCKLKEKCIRWLEHYPKLKNHPRLSMISSCYNYDLFYDGETE